MNELDKNDFEHCRQLIKNHPFFALLTPNDIDELTHLMQKTSIKAGTAIVHEDDIVDRIYLIASGTAEVTRTHTTIERKKTINVGNVKLGDIIGLSETNYFSSTGFRLGTVIASSTMILYSISILSFYNFLRHTSGRYPAITAVGEQILLVNFIRKTYLFEHLSAEKTYRLVHKFRKILMPANSILFHQNEKADQSYFILSGELIIFNFDKSNREQVLAKLGQSSFFGEAALIPGGKRNASARTETEVELFALTQKDFYDTIKIDVTTSSSLNELRLLRAKPNRKENILVENHLTPDNQEIIFLSNRSGKKKLPINQKELVAWQHFDGHQSLTSILNELKKIEDTSANELLIFTRNLLKLGFIQCSKEEKKLFLAPTSFWSWIIYQIKHLIS